MTETLELITELAKPEPRAFTPAEVVAALHYTQAKLRMAADFIAAVLEGDPASKFDGPSIEMHAKCVKVAAKKLGELYYAQTGKELSVF